MAGLGRFVLRIFLGLLIFPFCLGAIWAGVANENPILAGIGLLFGAVSGGLLIQLLVLSNEKRLTLDAGGLVLHGVLRDTSVPWEDVKEISVRMLGDDDSQTCQIRRHSRRAPVWFTITDLQEPPEVILREFDAARARARGIAESALAS